MNVVSVKRRGENAHNAGEEYTTALAHCANMEQAARWLLNYLMKVEGVKVQEDEFARSGTQASLEAFTSNLQDATAKVLAAVREQDAIIQAAALTKKDLARAAHPSGAVETVDTD